MRSPSKKVRPAALGMMIGLVLGAGIGTLLFVVTMNALWFTAAGVGLAFGLGLGAAVEQRQKDERLPPHPGA